MTNITEKDATSLPSYLDHTILENLRTLGGEDDHEFFISVIDQFLTDLPRHLEDIQQAIVRQNPESLVMTAHSCKGSSRSIGATRLAEISYELERMGREGTMKDSHKKFEQWLQEQERTILALQQERHQHTSSAL